MNTCNRAFYCFVLDLRYSWINGRCQASLCWGDRVVLGVSILCYTSSAPYFSIGFYVCPDINKYLIPNISPVSCSGM